MNTFKRFILGEQQDVSARPAKAAAMVYAECQPFLKEIDYRSYGEDGRDENQYLYRGMAVPSTNSLTFLKCDVLENRKPRDMPLNYHLALDEYLYKKFGIKYRSNAIFATGKLGRAADYGKVYMIFPIGEFKFIWDSNIGDIWENLVHPKLHLTSGHSKYHPPSWSEDPIDIFSHMLKVEDYYKDADLKGAISSGNEIMISCKNYYAVSVFYSWYGEGFKDHLDKLFK